MDTRKAFDELVQQTFNDNTSNPYRGLSVIKKAAKRTTHIPTPDTLPDLETLFMWLLKETIQEIVKENVQPDMFAEDKENPWDFLTGEYFETYAMGLGLNPDFVLDAVKFDIEVERLFSR